MHCHSTGGACQIDAAQREAVNPNAAICQSFNGCTYVHRVSAEPIQFRHKQYVAFFHSAEQVSKSRPLFCTDAT
ncbi:hypothetical protein X948_5427 [Burkholderia pseudomallei MSHR5608]|nr:hypothetical protein X948_5427 [Burkholderia pseudomallei MSHR5608]